MGPIADFEPNRWLLALTDVVLDGQGHRRLDKISVRIGPGRTAIVGLSGAGKTSLLNVMSGFEPPSSGTVQLGIPTISAQLPRFWIPQNGGLWPHLRLREHLTCVAPTQGDAEKYGKKADEIVRSLDLTHRESAFPDELSQGERSRLVLARALMSDAGVILADEPLAHVDVVRKPDFWNVIDRWFNRKECAFVFSCHEPEIILKHAERVIVMESGRITFDGSVDQLYETPPSKIAGQFLGPLNWLEAADQQMLTGRAEGKAVPVRPERVNLMEDSGSHLEVIFSRRSGCFLETTMRSTESGDQSTLLHLGQAPMREFSRVAVRMERHVD